MVTLEVLIPRMRSRSSFLSDGSSRPVFDIQAGNLSKVFQISAEQQRIGHQRHAGDSQIERRNPNFQLSQRNKFGLCLARERHDVHLPKETPHEFQFAVSMNDFVVRLGLVEVRLPAGELFLETNDRGRDVVWSNSVEPAAKPIAVRLRPLLENGEVICVEQHRHRLALRSIGAAQCGTQFTDFREDLVPLERTLNLIEPGNSTLLLIGQHNGSFGGVELLKFGNSIRPARGPSLRARLLRRRLDGLGT